MRENSIFENAKSARAFPGASFTERKLGCDLRFCHLNDVLERFGIANGDIGKNLSIKADIGFFQTIDEDAVADIVNPASCIDADDPEGAKVLPTIMTIVVSMFQSLVNSFLNRLLDVVVTRPIALGKAEKFLFLAA